MKYIYIGKIVNTHGLKGEIRILSDFKYKELIFKDNFKIYIGEDKIPEVINSYRHHKIFDMITIKGINNINDVLKYKGKRVYVNKEDIPFLTELGVKDSKKLSDEQILKIVPKIIKRIKYKTIMLSNKEYNEKYGKDMNMNKIKAVLHNKVLTEMVKDNVYDYIVVDQFEPESSYYKHLSEVPNPLRGITFITKAEDKCLSVACASLISRYIFVKEIDKLGDKYGIFLPKGANYYVEDVGIKLVEKYGVNVLKEVAKLNFSNTDRILKEVRK